MKQTQVHTKALLSPNRYNFTITQAYKDESPMGRLILCATVNTGEDAYRHVLLRYENNARGLGRLKQLLQALNKVWYGEFEDEKFTDQFIGMMFSAATEVILDHNKSVWRNVLNDYEPMIGLPGYNVLKPKSDEHFFTTKNKKKLPV